MDKQERARLRALCEAATAGPWAGESSSDAYYRLTAISPDRGHSDVLAEFRYPQKFVDGERVVDDARKAEVVWNLALCEAARTAIPALLDALDAAEAELKHWRPMTPEEAEQAYAEAEAEPCDQEMIDRIVAYCNDPANIIKNEDRVSLDVAYKRAKKQLDTIRRATVEAIVARLRERHYDIIAGAIESEFLTEKGE